MKSTEGLKSALATWENLFAFKSAFIRKHTDPDGGEPLCGYDDWDEYLTDINYDLADLGEILAAAIKEHLND